MNLKVEDLERELNNNAKRIPNDMNNINGGDSLDSLSLQSINPQSFVLASMKEALAQASSVKQHGSAFVANRVNSTGAGSGGLIQEINDSLAKRNADATATTVGSSGEPPKEYEKMLQKLESDIRGHIRVSI